MAQQGISSCRTQGVIPAGEGWEWPLLCFFLAIFLLTALVWRCLGTWKEEVVRALFRLESTGDSSSQSCRTHCLVRGVHGWGAPTYTNCLTLPRACEVLSLSWGLWDCRVTFLLPRKNILFYPVQILSLQMEDTKQKHSLGYQMCSSPSSDLAACALLPCGGIAESCWAPRVLSRGSEWRCQCKGWFVRGAIPQGLWGRMPPGFLIGGAPEGSCTADLGGQWAALLWWHWTDILVWWRLF